MNVATTRRLRHGVLRLLVDYLPADADRQARECRVVGVDEDRSIEASRSKRLGTQGHVDSEGAARRGRRRRADVERVHVRADTAKSKCSGALFDEGRLLEKVRRSRMRPKAVESHLAEIDLVGIRVDVRLDQDVNGEAYHSDHRVAALELEGLVVAAG